MSFRTLVKTFTWRGVAAVDSFAVFVGAGVWVGGAVDWKVALAAAGTAVGLEAVTKVGWFYIHEKVWEGPMKKFLAK